MMIKTVLACVLAGTAVSAASANQISISNIGGGIVLNSGPLGLNAFGNAQTDWTTASLTSVNAALDSNGINTNGRITILAADTDHGLAMMAIIDQQLIEGAALMGHVHMDSSANGDNLAFLNDSGALVTVSPNAPNVRNATGNFTWNSNGGGDAFAWAGLQNGNSITFRFDRSDGVVLGLNDPSTFQFVNWTGSAWAAVNVPANLLTFSATNDYGFSAIVLPSPSVIMTAAPMLGLSMIRRRRAR